LETRIQRKSTGTADKGEPFRQRLRDQHSIKRTTMIADNKQFGKSLQMDRFDFEADRFQSFHHGPESRQVNAGQMITALNAIA
jgi:hypothetical protein